MISHTRLTLLKNLVAALAMVARQHFLTDGLMTQMKLSPLILKICFLVGNV
jgi:hypothetical protein